MSERRTRGVLLVGAAAATVAALGGVALFTSGGDGEGDATSVVTAPAPPLAEPRAAATEEVEGAAPEGLAPGQVTTLDVAELIQPEPRRATFVEEGGVLVAEGVQVRTDEPTVVYAPRSFEAVRFTQRLQALRLMKGEREVKRFEAKKSEASLEKQGAMSVIRYGDVFPDVDVKYTYDGTLVEEFVIFSDAFKETLAKSGADRVEVVSRIPEIRKGRMADQLGLGVKRGALPSLVEGDFVSSEELQVTHAMLPVATLPKSNAFVEGQQDDKASHVIAERAVSVRDDGAEIAVALPATYLAEAAGAVYLDPSIIDPFATYQHGWTQGRRIVRDSTGRYHAIWMRYANYPDNGQTRWRVVYAYGDGTDWTYHGPIRLPFDGNTHLHQYYPSMTIDGDDNIYVSWMEYHVRPDPDGEEGPDPDPADTWQVYTARGFESAWTPLNGGNRVHVNDTEHQYPGALAVDSANRVHLYFGQSAGTAAWAYLEPGETTWTLPTFGTARADQPDVRTSVSWYAEGSATTDYNNNFIIAVADSPSPYIVRCVPNFGANSGACTDLGAAPSPWADNDSAVHVSIAVDSDNYYHVVWRLASNQFAEAPGEQTNARIAYARFNGNAGSWVAGSEALLDNGGWAQDNPDVAVDSANNVHVAYTEFAFPERAQYHVLPATAGAGNFGAWQDRGELTPFDPGTQYYINLMSSVWPASSRVQGGDVVTGTYTRDYSELAFFTSGQPVERVNTITPLNHTYVRTLRPTFTWDRLSTDRGDVTYHLEIATTPLFDSVVVNKPALTGNPGDQRIDYTLTAGEALTHNNFYYWRVTPSNSFGAGPTGSYLEVGVDTVAPTAFDLTGPSGQITTQTPRFEWEVSVDNN